MEQPSHSIVNVTDPLGNFADPLAQFTDPHEQLFRAREMNRDYIPFTTDSVMKMVAEYYDRHGTPTERIEAHYLLGCAYRDMGEAPMALHCFQDAVDLATGTSTQESSPATGTSTQESSPATITPTQEYTVAPPHDPPLASLIMKIYGQMAELYDAQNLPDDEIRAMKAIQRYALIARDSLMYIRAVELMTKPYYKLGDTAKVVETIWEAHRLYTAAGDSCRAANAFATLAHIMVKRGRLEEADSLLCEYETKTGLFDSRGNIARGHEMYYYIKGNYYLEAGKASRQGHSLTDSAETFFRRLLPDCYPADAYRGLLAVYQRRMQPDSVVKYAALFEAAVDSLNNRRRIETVHQMAKLYDYHRLQKNAHAAALAAAEARNRANILIVAVTLLMVVASTLFVVYRRGKKRELDRMSEECLVVSGLLAKARMELDEERRAAEEEVHSHDDIKAEMQEKLQEKSAEVDELEARLQLLEEQYHTMTHLSGIEKKKNSEAVKAIRRRAEWKHGAEQPSASEWMKLTNQFRLDFPHYYATLMQGKKMSTMEIRTCMLLLLDFKEGEIAVLLDVKPQRVTNIKKRVNMKLFDDDSAATLTGNIEAASGFRNNV